ncbi:hypothetical protein F5B20DRAFT_466181 [Whalleya microplaca]|nr:hypothetical protein F5B20DRAFT_466181 [Whalleya microplaca]
MSIRVTGFQRMQTEDDWAQFLCSILSALGRQIYLVVDLDAVDSVAASLKAVKCISDLLESSSQQSSSLPGPSIKVIASACRLPSSNTTASTVDPGITIPVKVTGRKRQQAKEIRRAIRGRVGRSRPAR